MRASHTPTGARIRFLLALLLGALFVYAGISKVMDPAQFFLDIQNYDLIPWQPATVALAFYLPWLEIICGVAVIAKPLRAGALMILTTMLLIFTASLAIAWARGLNISCGCFGGSSDHPRYLLWIGRDMGLFVVAVVLTVAEWPSRGDRCAGHLRNAR